MNNNIILFQDLTSTSFKSDRLRKNIKAALKEVGYTYSFEKLEKESQIAHFLPPFKYSQVERAKSLEKKVVISAFYTEGEKSSAISNLRSVNDISKITISKDYLKSFEKADKILVPSIEYKKALIKKGIKDKKINILSPGANTKIYRYLPETDMELSRRYYSINPDAKIVLFFGGVNDTKLINSFNEFARLRPDCKCVLLVTNKDSIDSISFKIKQLLRKSPENTIITSFKDINVYRSLLKNSRVLVYLNSYYIDEIQMLEAMASDLQVIGISSVFSKDILEREIIICRDNKKELFRDVSDFLDYKISNTISNASFYTEERDVKQIGLQLKEIYNDLFKEENEDDWY